MVLQGIYQLTGAKMLPAYLDPFIGATDAQFSRYRIEMLFHKKGATVDSELKQVRGCIDMELELIF